MLRVHVTSLSADDHGIFLHTFSPFFEQVSPEDAEFIFVVPVFEGLMDSAKASRIEAAGKPIVVFDYLEYHWELIEAPDAILGLPLPPHASQYKELSEWLAKNKPKAYFKLNLRGTHPNTYPIDWYNAYIWGAVDSKVEFDSRPIDVLFIYGQSHPMRAQFHGLMMQKAFDLGWTIITHPDHIEHEIGPKIMFLHQPWWDRLPAERVYEIQSQAKITISLPGFGAKCFRDSEAPVNSVMGRPDNGTIYQAGWDDSNSIRLIGDMKDWPRQLRNDVANRDLYRKYLAGTKRSEEIKPDKVWENYIEPKINATRN